MSAIHCEDSLNKLTAAVNQTLIESGRFFRTSGSLQSRTRLKHALPAANEDFQTALDQLSLQIFLAKAVLERDFESVRANKSTLKRANPRPEPMQIDQRHISPKPVQPPSVAHEASPSRTNQTGSTLVTDPQPAAQKDISAGDGRDLDGQHGGNNAAPRLHSPSGTVAASNAPDENNNDDLQNGIGGIAGARVGPSDPLHTSQTIPDLSKSPVLRKETDSSAETFDSLLPGLEAYANAGTGDTAANQQASDDRNAAGDHERPSDVQMEDMPQSESNFENLFVGNGMDFGDSEDLLNNVEIGELDDSWFS